MLESDRARARLSSLGMARDRFKPFGGVGPSSARPRLKRQLLCRALCERGHVMLSDQELMPAYCKLSAHLPPGSLQMERSVCTDISNVASNQVLNPVGDQAPNLVSCINVLTHSEGFLGMMLIIAIVCATSLCVLRGVLCTPWCECVTTRHSRRL